MLAHKLSWAFYSTQLKTALWAAYLTQASTWCPPVLRASTSESPSPFCSTVLPYAFRVVVSFSRKNRKPAYPFLQLLMISGIQRTLSAFYMLEDFFKTHFPSFLEIWRKRGRLVPSQCVLSGPLGLFSLYGGLQADRGSKAALWELHYLPDLLAVTFCLSFQVVIALFSHCQHPWPCG